MSDGMTDNKPPRRRRLTTTTLTWLAERVRKALKIKEQLDTGTYAVDTEKVARAIANEE